MERKLIDYEKLKNLLEERIRFYGSMASKQLHDLSVDVADYADTIARWSVYTDLLNEIEATPF
ncbi:MAG: hypothetical protein E7678_02930 [Ruminococcaceae bacterium]|nr:hypothetical protein [Oscillospiraceae bacterium]